MTEQSFEAMKASPAAALAALATGIASELGVDEEDVTIQATSPALDSRRLEAWEARRLAEVKPTPVTHAVLTPLKAGKTVYQVNKTI